MPFNHPAKLALVHIPKTGGVAVHFNLGCGFDVADMYGVDGDFELAHASVTQMRARVPMDGYTTVAVVRNPWDRLVSEWLFRLPWPACPTPWGTPYRPEFAAFARDACATDPKPLPHVAAAHLYDQLDFVCAADDRVDVDWLCRFEFLTADLALFRRRVGLPPLPLVPANVSSGRQPYQVYYTPDLAAMVATRYRRDVEAFGYSFGR